VARPFPLRQTGIPELDKMFGGGFPASLLVHVIGDAGSGKSFVASSAATTSVLQGMRVMYISTTNDISVKRMQAMLESAIRTQEEKVSQNPVSLAHLQEVLLVAVSRLQVQHCFDIFALLDLLTKLKSDNQYDLVVLDSLHHVITPLLENHLYGTAGAGAGAGGLRRSISTVAAASVSAPAHAVQGNQNAISSAATATATAATTTGNSNSNSNSGSSGAPVPLLPLLDLCGISSGDFLNALLSQLGVLLKALTSQRTTVLVTNVSEQQQQQQQLQRRASFSSSSGGGAAAISRSSTLGPFSAELASSVATGMSGGAFIDLMDVTVILAKVPNNEQGFAANSLATLLNTRTPNTSTKIRAGQLLSPLPLGSTCLLALIMFFFYGLYLCYVVPCCVISISAATSLYEALPKYL
jgi:RecA/RadA recombinase